ncbi:MAG: glutamine-hydrolyzing GMP synthase [Actinopolymorphaceae bacterium]
MVTDHDLVLVVDYGAQYAQLIARRVREAKVYSEIVPHSMPVAEMLARGPKAIVLSGGPSSVYAEGAPGVDVSIFTAGVPVFGMCYGFQLMARELGGEVAHTGAREYGRTRVKVSAPGTLLADLPPEHSVWMSHGDSVTAAPTGFDVLAATDATPVAAFEDVARGLAGVQWHPEVLHTEHGQTVLEHFLLEIAGCRPTWTMANIIDEQVERIRERVGDARALCALSGGVDSAVAAAIVERAIGDRLTCVYVDNGMMRLGETEQVKRDFEAVFSDLDVVDASDQFLDALAGVEEPEEKRRIVGREFIRTFEAAEVRVFGALAEGESTTAFLVQGTLYPDVVESGGGTGTSTIKSHHNVGGLPDDIKFELIEPLRTLFKDEVRAVGEQLGLPPTMVWRHPFPGPGLGIRIIGAVDRERLDIVRRADAVVREELTAAGLDGDIWQFPVVLLAGVRSVGVQGDGRTYGHPIVLRPVTSEDAMTADWARLPYDLLERISTRITNEVREVNRVVLDITSKPPGTIEWE